MKNLPENLHAAYFDVDGTLTRSNIVEPLLYIKKRVMSSSEYKLWKAVLPFRFFYWSMLDIVNRERSTAAIYQQYKGISVKKMTTFSSQCYEEKYKKKFFSEALETIYTFRKQRTRIVLVSGSLDIFLQSLAWDLGAELIASRLETKEGVYTGRLAGLPVVGKQKAELINSHAQKHQLDLEHCASFGNSTDDIPMLCSVKYPVAINPDKGLTSYAKKNNWASLIWS